jgi:O-antigen/teichoic acid export membrane protein
MVRNFLKSSVYYVVSKGLTSGINLIVFAYISRKLDMEQMGYYALLTVSLLFLGFFMTLEIQSGFTRFYLEQKNEKDRHIFQYSIINLLIISNLTIGSLLFVGKRIIENIFVPIDSSLFLILVFTPFSTVLANLYFSRLRLENKYKTVSILVIVQSLIYGCSVLIGIQFISSVVTAVFLAGLIQQFFILVLYIVALGKISARIDFSLIRQSIRFSIVLLPTVFGINISNISSKYIAGKAVNIASAGIYEILNKISNIMMIIVEPIYQAFTPIIYGNYKNPEFKSKYYVLLGLNLLVVLLLVLGFSLFNSEILLLIAGEKYLPYTPYLYVFIFIAALQLTSRLFELNIYLAHREKSATIIELFIGGGMVALSYHFATIFGLEGIVFVILGVYMLRLVLYVYFSNRYFKKFYVNPWIISGFFLLLAGFQLFHASITSLNLYVKAIIILLEIICVCLLFLKMYKISLKELAVVILRRRLS